MHSEIYIRKLVTDRGWFGNAFIDYAISKIEVSQLLPEEKEEYCIIKGLLKSNPKNIAKNIFLLHGDIHLGNVLVNNGVPYLIDFDSIQRGHFEQDIANHIMMTPFKAVLEDKNYIIDNSHIKTFLKGYELHSPLAINKPLLELYCRVIRLLLLIDYRGRMDNKMLKDYALRSISILDYFTE
jgi:Ser/Thr protein kinase RdoA (MazF antagonist)